MNIPYCPFTNKGNDPLFLKICEVEKFKLPPRKLKALWRQAFKHFVCLSEYCKDFWTKFGPNDEIDISTPAASFYNVALVKIEWRTGAPFPRQLANNHAKLLSHNLSKDEVVAFNAFINGMIQAQRNDPVARYRAGC